MPRTSMRDINNDAQILTAVQELIRLRNREDIPETNNLQQRFVLGRSTQRIPSSSTDIISGDKKGDITNDDTYEYKLIEKSAGLYWDRRILGVW